MPPLSTVLKPRTGQAAPLPVRQPSFSFRGALAASGRADLFGEGAASELHQAATAAQQQRQQRAAQQSATAQASRLQQDTAKIAAEAEEKARKESLAKQVAQASLAKATAPKTLSDSEREAAGKELAKNEAALRSSAAATLQQRAITNPKITDETHPWIPFYGDPTEEAAKLQAERDRLSDAANVTDDDMQAYRATAPEQFKPLDDIKAKLAKDDEDRAAAQEAERQLNVARAKADGLSDEEIAQVLPPAAAKPIGKWDAVSESGKLEREAAELEKAAGLAQSYNDEAAALQQRGEEIRATLQAGVRGEESAALMAELSALQTNTKLKIEAAARAKVEYETRTSAHNAKAQLLNERTAKSQERDTPKVSTATAQALATKDATGNVEIADADALDALDADGKAVFWRASVTPSQQAREAKRSEYDKELAAIRATGAELTKGKIEATRKIEDRVKAGELSPQDAQTEEEKTLQQFEAQHKEQSAVVNAKVNNAVRDFAEGLIDSSTLNTITDAAGMGSSGVELFREKLKSLAQDEANTAALVDIITGKSAESPGLNGQGMALTAKLARYDRQARGWTALHNKTIDPLNVDMSNPTFDTSNGIAGKKAAERQKLADETRAELTAKRQQWKSTLTAELVKKGVPTEDHARIIAQAEMQAAEKAVTGFSEALAARGGGITAAAGATAEKVPLIGGLFEVARLAPYADMALRLEAGDTLNDDEMASLGEFARFANREQTTLLAITDGIASSLSLGAEIALSAGTSAALKQGGMAAFKKALTWVTSDAAKSALTTKAALSTTKTLLSKVAKNMVKAPLYAVTTGGSKTLAKFTRDTALQGVQVSEDEGRIIAAIGPDRHDVARRSFDAVFDQSKEFLTGKLGRAIPLVGRMNKGNILGKSWAAMSDKVKNAVVSKAIIGTLKKLNPAVQNASIGKFLKAANVQGIGTEFLEERAGDVVDWAKSGIVDGEWDNFRIPTGKDLIVELATLIIPGAIGSIQSGRATAKLNRSIEASDKALGDHLTKLSNPQQAAEYLSKRVGADVTADDMQAALDLTGPAVLDDTVRAADADHMKTLERAAAYEQSGNDSRAQIARQMALSGSRARQDLADEAAVRSLNAAMEIGGIREAATQAEAAAAELNTQLEQAVQSGQEVPADLATAAQQAAMEAEMLKQGADRAAALVKIAKGREASLTTAEQAALEMADTPAIEEVDGGIVITDAGRAELQKLAPTAASYIRQTETQRREQLTRASQANASQTPDGLPVDTAGVAVESAADSSQAGEGDGIPRPLPPPTSTQRVVSNDTTAGNWTAKGTKGTPLTLPATAAKSAQEAAEKMAALLPQGEDIDGSSILPPKGQKKAAPAAKAAPRSTESKATAPVATDRSGDTKGYKAAVFRHNAESQVRSELPKRLQGRGAKVIDALEATLAKHARFFPRVKLERSNREGGGVSIDSTDKTLIIRVGDIAAQTGDMTDAELASYVDTLVKHEASHRFILDVTSNEEAANAWRQLGSTEQGKALQDDVIKAYEAGGSKLDTDFKKGHEMLRMFFEDEVFAGRVTEAAAVSPGLKEALRDFLRNLVTYLRKNFARLPDAQKAPIREILDKAKARAKALGVDIAETTEETNTTIQAADARITKSGEAAAPETKADVIKGNTGTLYTSTGEPVEYQWAVVEAADLLPSHDKDGKPTKGYDQGLQPRTGARSQGEKDPTVAEIRRRMAYHGLSDAKNSREGSPVVDAKMQVEAGNGRALGISLGYSDGKPAADGYKAELVADAAAKGIDTEKVKAMKAPVLVRIRTTNVNAAAFAADSNQGGAAKMTKRDQAVADAKNLTPDTLAQLEVDESGNLFSVANMPFFRQFFRETVGQQELASLVNVEDGTLNQTGLERIRNAVFVAAYGDSDSSMAAFERLAESVNDDPAKNLSRALMSAAPQFARLEALIRDGVRHPVSIASEVAKAANIYATARDQRQTIADYLAQGQMIPDGATDLTRSILRFIEANKQSSFRIAAGFRGHAQAVETLGDPRQGGLFGAEPVPTAEEVWEIVSKQQLGAARRATAQSPFYSKLAQVIEQKMPARADSKTVAGLISNPQTGIKAEELKWSGIMPWLEGQTGPITKADVLDYLETDGAVTLEEVRVGGRLGDRYDPALVSQIDEVTRQMRIYREDAANVFGDDRSKWPTEVRNGPEITRLKNEHERLIRLRDEKAEVSATKYAQYQLPGGENYREVVLAMPKVGSLKVYDTTNGKTIKEGFQTFSEAQRYIRENALKGVNIEPIPVAKNYTSSHFPDVPNYVAHMRLNDRADAEGKAGTFIEEIQSDRHQAGRKKGYREDAIAGLTVIKEEGGWNIRDDSNGRVLMTEPFTTESEANERLATMTRDGRNSIPGQAINNTIPDAPFRKDWPLQMFKRALADAAAAGKSWIGWTTGETQNERFDLSKHVDSLNIRKQQDGLWSVIGIKGGSEVVSQAGLSDSKLADTVGKELAEKAIKDMPGMGYRVYSGDELKVGGSGMKGFYDNMLPKEIGKYVKQWGGKVERSSVTTLALLQDTPEIITARKDVDKAISNAADRVTKAKQEIARKAGIEESLIQYVTVRNDDEVAGEPDVIAARNALREVIRRQSPPAPIWRVDITPQMKTGVASGQALFAARRLPDTGTGDLMAWGEQWKAVSPQFKGHSFSVPTYGMSGNRYRYEMRARPPSINTHPTDGLIAHIEGGTRHGYLDYNRKLTDEEVYNYELKPVQSVTDALGNAKVNWNPAKGLTKTEAEGWESLTAEMSSPFEIFPYAADLYVQVPESRRLEAQRSVMAAYLEDAKASGFITSETPAEDRWNMYWEDGQALTAALKPFVASELGTAARQQDSAAALRTYRQLTKLLAQGAKLPEEAHQRLEDAERTLGQLFLFDQPERRELGTARRAQAKAVETLGDPRQGGLFGNEPTPTAAELWESNSQLGASLRPSDAIASAFQDWEYGFDRFGLPNPPRTLADGHDLLKPTHEKRFVRLQSDNPLVKAGLLPANRDVVRKALESAIVRFFITKGTPLANDATPTVYATGGGGGAGKSSVLKRLSHSGRIQTTGAVHVNSDDIKELIPEFDALKNAGDGRAAAVVHEESSAIAKTLLARLLDPKQPRFNFVYDATLANIPKALQQFRDWRAAGYAVHLIGVSVDPSEGMTRAALRAKDSGRWVPNEELAKAHAGFNGGLAELAEAADVATVWDNTPPDPHEVARKTGRADQLFIANPSEWSKIESRKILYEGQNDTAGGLERDRGSAGQAAIRKPEPQGEGNRGSDSGQMEGREGREGQLGTARRAQDTSSVDFFGNLFDTSPQDARSLPVNDPGRPKQDRTASRKPKSFTAEIGDLFGWAGGTGAGQSGSSRGSDRRLTGSGESSESVVENGPDTEGDVEGSTEDDLSGKRGGLDNDVGDKRGLSPRLSRPPEGDPARNHVIPQDTVDIAPRSNDGRMRANIEALELVKRLEDEDRNATPEEKTVLAKFSGWGWNKEMFNPANPRYATEHAKLRAVLSEEEFRSAAAVSLFSHFTAPQVIKSMWTAVRRLGFKGGKVAEGAAGIGHFFGMMPGDLADLTKLTGVEIDRTTGRILTKLYPEAKITIEGFQDARIPNNSLDLFISNVPFDKTAPYDPAYDRPGIPSLNLHNYFIAKALDKVKPGGLVAVITSSSTLQNNRDQREYLATRGDLVGAIRLPNDAFKGNANTEVTTDILFFRKPDGSQVAGHAFVNLAEVGRHEGLPIMANEYFADNPGMALGRHSLEGTQYKANEYALVSHKGQDIIELLNTAVEALPENILGAPADTDANEEPTLAAKDSKESSYQLDERGRIMQVQYREGLPYLEPADLRTESELADKDSKGEARPPKVLSEKTQEKRRDIARAYIKIRDYAIKQIDLELNPNSTDEEIERNRRFFKQAYDRFVQNHGTFNSASAQYSPIRFLEDDPEHPLVLALENEKTLPDPRKSGRTIKVFRPAAILRERVLRPAVMPDRADTVDDAILISMGHLGRIDEKAIAKLIGTDEGGAVAQIEKSDYVYREPQTGALLMADHYLTGNVRAKLAEAVAATKDSPEFARNVKALESVQPPLSIITEIAVPLGNRWMPTEVYDRFASELFDGAITVAYSPQANKFIIRGAPSAKGRTEWGTSDFSPNELLEHAMHMTTPRVVRTSKGVTTEDHQASAIAQSKVKKLKEAFEVWLLQTPDIHRVVENAYDTKVNHSIAPRYSGDYLALPGLSADVRRMPHRLRAIAKVMQDGGGMLAHGVGSGKTFTLICCAMEMRRLGRANKPVIAVQKATIGQFAKSFRQAYPNAKILVANEKTFSAKNRARFFARIATQDWDAVVVTQPQLDLIRSSPQSRLNYFNEIIAELEMMLREAAEGDDKARERVIQQRLRSLRKKLDKVLADLEQRGDNTLWFDQLGIDALLIDEAHAYKRLPIITNMASIKGIPTGDSDRAMNLEMATRLIHSRTGGRNVVLATGTPVTNTMAEIYVMLKLSSPAVLREYGIDNFDDFASMYGRISEKVEQTWGQSYKVVARFNKFTNGRELTTMIRSGFDVAMGNAELGLDVPPMKGGKPQIIVSEPTQSQGQFNAWVEEIAARFESLEGKEKREYTHIPIVTMQAGMAAALDPRLVDPNAKDEPNSKVNVAVRNIVKIFNETADRKGTQLVFADRFKPMNTSKLREFVPSGMGSIEGAEDWDVAGQELDEELDEEEQAKAAGKAEDKAYNSGGFNLYKDIKAKLIASGIPEAQIAIIHDYNTDKRREQLFDAVNAGEVRIVLGSTEKMGVGVNAQERLAAMHHLDPPRSMTPAMVEQRDGRGVRQGNLHFQWYREAYTAALAAGKTEAEALEAAEPFALQNLRYATQDSMDVGIIQMLESKQAFITQALKGYLTDREFADPADDVSLSFAEMRALATGDTRIMRQVQLREDVRRLQLERDGFLREKALNDRSLIDTRNRIEHYEKMIPILTEAKAQHAATFGADQYVITTTDGTKVESKDAVREWLDNVRKDLTKIVIAGGLKRSTRFDYNGFTVRLEGQLGEMVAVPQEDGSLKTENRSQVNLEVMLADSSTVVFTSSISEGYSAGQAFAQMAKTIERRANDLSLELPGLLDRAQALQESSQRKWSNEAALLAQQTELAELEAALVRKKTPKAELGTGRRYNPEEAALAALDAKKTPAQLLASLPIDQRKANVQNARDYDASEGLSFATFVADELGAARRADRPEVLAEIQAEKAEIERQAKADGTWMKAPNGQLSKLNEGQWVAVRTRRFKEWFGDWEGHAQERAYTSAIDAIIAGTYDMTRPVNVGATPAVLLAAGADALPITMRPGMVQKVTQDAHDLPPDTVRQIASAIKDPVFVFESATVPDALTVILDLQHNGSSILVAVHLNSKSGRHEVNAITSIYDKSNPRGVEGWIKAGLLRYTHTKKSRAWFQSRGLQLPKEGSKRGNPKLRTDADIVNRAVNPDSVSKVVDENGEPMVVYHGTDAPNDFNSFDLATARSDVLPNNALGHFFTPSPDSASYFAEGGIFRQRGAPRTYPVFLSIKKPQSIATAAFNEWNNGSPNMSPSSDGLFVGDSNPSLALEIVAAAANQIKSASANVGTYDKSNDSILSAGRRNIDDSDIQGYFDLDAVRVPAAQQPAAKRAIKATVATTGSSYLPATSGSVRDAGKQRELALRTWRGLVERDAAALREHFESGSNRISSLLHDFISNEIPRFDVVGAVIESPADMAALNLAIRTPWFESLKVAVMGPGNQVIHSQILHVGALSESTASAVRITAVINAARAANPKIPITGFVLAHNHPSGDPSPSDADWRTTRLFTQLGNTIGVPMVDHVVTNGERYFSFREAGLSSNASTGQPLINADLPQRYRNKPRLPIMPTPERPAPGVMADYEVVPAMSRPIALSPDEIGKYVRALGTGDPLHSHIIYLSTRGAIAAVERVPSSLSEQDLAATIISGVAREGAHMVVIGKPHQSDDPSPSDATVRSARALREMLRGVTTLQDMVTTTPHGRHFSFSHAGILGAGRRADPTEDGAWNEDEDGPRLFSHNQAARAALDTIAANMPSRDEMDDIDRRSGIDWSGPDLTPEEVAQMADNVKAGIDYSYHQKLQSEKHMTWNARASALIDADPQAVLASLVASARDKKAIDNPVMVKAAQLMIPALMRQAIATRNMGLYNDAQAIAYAYDITGSEQGRALAARWQPHLSAEDKHREMLAKMIFNPPHEVQAKVDRAKTPRQKQAEIDRLRKDLADLKADATAAMRALEAQMQAAGADIAMLRQAIAAERAAFAREKADLEARLKTTQAEKDRSEMLAEWNKQRLEQVEEGLAGMGVTLADLFISKEAVVRLRGSTIVSRALSGFNDTERKAQALRMEGMSDRQISAQTGISRGKLPAIFDRVDASLEAAFGEWVDRGFTVESLMSDDMAAELNTPARANLTPEERKARVKAFMGLVQPSTAARRTGAAQKFPGTGPSFGFNIGNPAHAARVARTIQSIDSTGFDAVYEYWINGLLSGLATHAANITGNLGNIALEYGIQRPAEAIVNTLLMRDAAGASISEYSSMAKYLGQAFSDAFHHAKLTWQAEASLFEQQWSGVGGISNASGLQGNNPRAAIKGTKGRVIRIPSRMLMFADEFAKRLVGRIEAAAQAHRFGMAQGLSGAALDSYVKAQVSTPGSNAWLQALKQAKAMTFQQDLPKWLEKFQQIKETPTRTPWGSAGKFLLRMLFPFIKTPWNITATSLRKTPLGTLRMLGKVGSGLYDHSKGKPFFDSYTRGDITKDLAEQIVGYVAFVIIAGMAEGDPDDDQKGILITGTRGDGSRTGERELLQRSRGGETSILINGKPVFNYGRYEPFATVLATMVNGLRRWKETDRGVTTHEALWKTAGDFVETARTKTFLQGMDSALRMLDAVSGGETVPGSLMKSVVTGIVPNIVRQTLRNTDDQVRDSRNAPLLYHAFPVGSLAEPLYDLYGRPVMKGGNDMSRLLFQAPTDVPTPQPADIALNRWNAANPLEKYTPTNPSKTMFRWKDAAGKWHQMTPSQIAAYRLQAGRDFAAQAATIFPTPKTPTAEQIADLKRLRDKSFSDTKKTMFPTLRSVIVK